VTGRLGSGLAVASTAALLAGCGGSSSSDDTAKFKTGFAPVVNQFKQTSQNIGTEIQGSGKQTDAQIAAAFRRLAGQWKTPLDELGGLTPPASVKPAFTTLSGSATKVERDLTAVAAAAAAHDKAAAGSAAARMVRDIISAKAASTKITDKLGIK
jgi:hypothetical protein